MAKEIELPDGTIGEFPDSMSDEDIKGVLRRKFPAPQQQSTPTTLQGAGMHPVAEQVGKAGRVLVNALASPAVLASRAYQKATKGTPFEVPMADLDAEINAGLDKLGIAKLDPNSLREQMTNDLAKSAPALALPASLPVQVAGNAAISAAQAPAGQEGTQAAIGGALGAGGHVLSKALGGIRPTQAAQELIDRGVALTPGQAAGVGSLPNRIEQWAASNPISALSIRGAQRRGIEEANRAAAESVVGIVEQGKKLGLPPREAVEQTRELISKHYDNALEGMTVPTDVARHQLDSQFQSILADNPMMTSKAFKHMRQYVANRFDNMRNNGVMHLDGPMLKQIDSEIGGQVRRLQSSTNAVDKTAAPAWRDLQQAVRDVMESGAGSPEQVTQLSQANAAYRQLLALEKALLPGSETFTPRRLSATLERMGIKDTDLNRVSESMTKTLPNTVPDSGTAERMIANGLPALLMGGGAGAHEMGWDTVGTGMIAAGALGSRTGARAMTGSLPGQQALATALRRVSPTAMRPRAEDE